MLCTVVQVWQGNVALICRGFLLSLNSWYGDNTRPSPLLCTSLAIHHAQ